MNGKDCWKTKWVLAAGIGLLVASHAAAGTLVLHAEAVIVADKIRVGDLCRLEGFHPSEGTNIADITVAAAPEVGIGGSVSNAELRNALQAAGTNMAELVIKGAARCDISRPRREEPVAPPGRSAQLASDAAGPHARAAAGDSGHTLRGAIEAFLTEDVGVQGARVNVQYGRVDAAALDLTSPPCSFEIKRTTGRRMGLVSLAVAVRDANGAQQDVPMLVNVSLNKAAVVAARGINQGAVIGATDVQIVDMTFTRADQLGMTDADAVVGQRAKRFIPSGQVVAAGDLEAVPLVKRGQIVNVESQIGGVSIVSVATAINGGAYGDVVELRTGDRGKREFSAVVAGPGRVRMDSAATAEANTHLAMGGTP